MAKKKYLAILEQGVEVWNRWRKENPKSCPDLSQANLMDANLSGANFTEVDFTGTNLSGANLTEANLSRANLTRAVISGANLTRANIREAFLIDTDLNASDLTEASLYATILFAAKLRAVNFHKADFSFAELDFNFFSDNDLSVVKGLETCIHNSPSSIGIDTIYKSKGRIPENFLRDAGVPDTFIKDVLPFIKDFSPIQYYSCFISYSGKDIKFAERLFADLQTKGLRVWFFPEDAKVGRTILCEVDEAIKVYDKLIVICSKNSLRSASVLYEIKRALEKEAAYLRQTGKIKDILTPITIDNYLYKEWDHPLKTIITNRKVVGDFRGCKSNMEKYSKALDKLMIALASEVRDATEAD